ncbi:MAG TPA: hypothetical protein VHB54_19960 [Mucilaginibacter sp.]|nr:hypothetical protein [Mucilaginibacter sp.]
MKKILFVGLLLMCSCTIRTPERIKAEKAVKLYLDSLNKNNKYEIIGFSNFSPVNTDYNDDPNYDKLKFNPVKADSIRKHYKSHIRAWFIDVTYRGKDYYDNFGEYKLLCALNGKLTKCVAGIEISGKPIK